ncbi:hypothetical protein PtB15_15B376 [Puccinia triticina]|nr:hypothetical protein PtB15_15B376 [Puccinia triticina]
MNTETVCWPSRCETSLENSTTPTPPSNQQNKLHPASLDYSANTPPDPAVSLSANALPSWDTLRFVGPADFNQKHLFWIGVELDKPSRKNNGSVDGYCYFTCPSRSIFV